MKHCANCINNTTERMIYCQNCDSFHSAWKSNGKPEIQPITIAEVRALSLKYYNRGADGYVECYEDYQIQEEIDAGAITVEDWLKLFEFNLIMEEEIKNA